MKVSVLMPVYQTKPDYLRAAIESVLSQTFTDFEFLIIDDSPEDTECEKIIHEYADSRIHYLRNNENLGISRVRNLLLKMAKGEYLAIMDHDDISLPTRFQEQVEFLDSNPEYGVCGCQHGFVGRYDTYHRPVSNDEINYELQTSLRCPLHHPSVMIRSSVMKKNHIHYEERYTPCEDYALWLRLSKVTKLYNLPSVLFVYRDFDNTTHKDLAKIVSQTKKAHDEILGPVSLVEKNERAANRYLRIRNKSWNIAKRVASLCLPKEVYVKLRDVKNRCFSGSNPLDSVSLSQTGPTVSQNKFLVYRELPEYAYQLSITSTFKELPKLGIVIQGPLMREFDFTLETVKIYKQIFRDFKFNVQIILSTWEDEDPEILQQFEKLGVIVLRNKKPNSGCLNSNFQIVSSINGLRVAKQQNCVYAIKTRSDQRMYETGIYEFLENIIHTFPLSDSIKQKVKLNSRIIFCSFNSYKHRLYGPSDMFMFGNIDDLIEYWSLELNSYVPDTKLTHTEINKTQCLETHLCRSFLKKIGHHTNDTYEDSLYSYAQYFCFVDQDSLGLFWPKYSSKMKMRYERWCNHSLNEISFKDWFNLYMRKGYDKEWIEQSYSAHCLIDYQS